MLLGKSALITILISVILSVTGANSRNEDGEPTTSSAKASASPTSIAKDWTTETTGPNKIKAGTGAPFRGYAKFVNNIATTNQGYDYKPINLSSRKPSRRPMTSTEKPVSSGSDDEPSSSSSSAQINKQKLRLIIRPDYKKVTKTKQVGKNSSEIVKTASSSKIYNVPQAGPCLEAVLSESQNGSIVDNLDSLKLGLEKDQRLAGVGAGVECLVSMPSGEPLNDSQPNSLSSSSPSEPETLHSASANNGNGNEKVKSSADDNDEDKKTLSQQVADGKYGLIHTELFSIKPTRPGILNYEINPEVPKDNVNNLGGLNAEEIWLAENHLLVLSGGGFSDKNSRTKWTPIDNYQAPRRQVKIPERPKVPPPFPVQLTDGGPIEFIKDENGTENRPPFFPPDFNPSAFPPPFFPFNSSDGPPPPQYPPPPGGGYGGGGFYPPANFTPGNQFPSYPPPPFPFFPGGPNDSRPLLPPRLPPRLPFPPPQGGGFGNQTEFDEDDPSLYYPPPYDFYYPKDNHSIVPPGPLIPGIVLPPPPDFFAPLEEKPKNKTKTKLRPRPKPTYLPPNRKPTPIFRTTTTTIAPPIQTTLKPLEDNEVVTPEYYYVPTTSPKAIVDEITNEITQTTISNPKYSLPINDNGWMPIPAPIPSYITGPKKPVKASVIYTIPQTTPPIKTIFNGYAYDKPKVQLKQNLQYYYKVQNPKYNNQDDFGVQNFTLPVNNDLNVIYPVNNDPLKDHRYGSSTTSPLPLYDSVHFKHNFKDYFSNSNLKGVKGFLQSTTDVPYKAYSSTLRPYGKPKALEATYYFYEEPRESSEEYTDNKSNQIVSTTEKPYQVPNGFKSSTLKPTLNQQSLTSFKNIPTSTTPMPDKFYYVADLNEPDNYNSYENKYKFAEPNKKAPKPDVVSRPIYEFSYIAPAYYGDHSGGVHSGRDPVYESRPFYDSPKYVTTPKPNKLVFINPVRTTQSPYDDYYSTTTPPKLIKNVTSSRATTQQTPWYGLSHQQVATDNPYYAFFTHQDDGLIDDITKTYFTIFGQKIKPTPPSEIDVPKKPPRPAPPKLGPNPPVLLNGAVYSSPRPNYIELPFHSTPQPLRPEVTTANYPTSSENYGAHYTTSRPPQLAFPYNPNPQNIQFTTPKPYYQEVYNANNKLVPIKFSTPQPTVDSSNQHQQYNPAVKIRPGVLFNDELVNYKRPLPPINPDAELLNSRPYRNNKYKSRPRLPSGTNQFISYRLPGNGGGHFYFLTPQAVPNFDSIDPLNIENPGSDEGNYYKRDLQRSNKVEPASGKQTKQTE